LRLRDKTIGTLNLLRNEVGELRGPDAVAAKAFADVATIGILHERSIRESNILTEQLQTALNTRIVIEQAKGVVAHTHKLPVDEAFALIRRHARAHRLPVSQIAAQLVALTLELDDPGDDSPGN
jgi:AmiR/NasT family two-component response regulator